MPPMLHDYLLSLAKGVFVDSTDDGRRFVQSATYRVTIPDRGAHLDAAISALTEGGCLARELANAGADAPQRAEVYFILARLALRSMLAYTWRKYDSFITLQPRGGAPEGGEGSLLSRLASLRRVDDAFVLEHPLSRPYLELRGAAALAAVDALAAPGTPLEPQLLRLFAAAGVTTAVRDGRPEEDADSALLHWEAGDLAFHAHSRFYREGRFGATFRFEGRTQPLPPLRPAYPGPRYELPAPDIDARRSTDPPFADVVERRQSVRTFDDDAPICLEELAELLYRVARVKESDGRLSLRPTPSGGGLWDLELYVAVRLCDGLEPGLYHYEPGDHILTNVQASADEFIASARGAMGPPGDEASMPQIVVVMASRFGRLQWKYERVAYALTLKHVGVVMQALYLTATAMGLGGTAIGGGHPEAFARATGNPPHVEGSVGEFALGRPLSNASSRKART